MATASNTNVELREPSTDAIVSDSLAVGVAFALALTVIQRIVGFLRGILFCRLMTDQQLGQWSMVWSFLMLLAPLAVLGLPGSFGRYVEYYRQRGQLRTFIRRVAIVSGIATLLLSGAIICFPAEFSWLIFRDDTKIAVAVAVGVALIFVSLINFMTSLVESLRQVRLVTVMRFILGIVFAIAGTGMLLIWDQSSAAVTYGYAIGCASAAIPAIWFLRKHHRQIVDHGEPLSQTAMWRRLAPFAIWLWFSNLFSNLFEVTDRYMLIHWSPVDANIAHGLVGQYHSGRVIPLLLLSVAAVLAGVLMPYMSAAWEKGDRKAVRVQLNWTIKLVALIFTGGGFLMILLAPLLFDYILQGRYNDGLAVLPLTLIYCIWFSLLSLGQDYMWVAEKGKMVFLAVGIGLLANFVLNWFLIPQWELWEAVVATSIANLIAVSICYLFNHWNGCRNDFGVWATLLAPLVLLMPALPGACLIAILVLAAYSTNWLFSREEKQQFVIAKQRFLTKIGMAR